MTSDAAPRWVSLDVAIAETGYGEERIETLAEEGHIRSSEMFESLRVSLSDLLRHAELMRQTNDVSRRWWQE